MEWKRALRAKLKEAGHRATPITRTSPEGKALSTHPNSYVAGCKYCLLGVSIETEPQMPAAFAYKIPGYGHIKPEAKLPECLSLVKRERAYPKVWTGESVSNVEA